MLEGQPSEQGLQGRLQTRVWYVSVLRCMVMAGDMGHADLSRCWGKSKVNDHRQLGLLLHAGAVARGSSVYSIGLPPWLPI